MKTGGRVFATPLRPLLRTQQVEIAALHELHAGAHQTNSFVAQVMRLPAGTCRNEHLTEQARRNDAIGLAGKAPIERTQGKSKAVTSLRRQPIRRTAAPSAGNEAPEAQCCIGACGEVCIERDDDCGGQIRVRAANEYRRQTVMPVIDEPVLAVGGAAPECWCEHADRTGVSEGFRRGCDEDGPWIEMRQPDDRRAVRSKIRMDREIVTPIARSATPTTQPDRQSHRRPFDNRADTPDFAAETPTQVLRT